MQIFLDNIQKELFLCSDSFFICWYNIIYDDHGKDIPWIWVFWNSIYFFGWILYRHQIIIEYIQMLYSNAVFPFFFKTQFFENDIRPNLIKDVFSIFNNGIQYKYLIVFKEFVRGWQKNFKFTS